MSGFGFLLQSVVNEGMTNEGASKALIIRTTRGFTYTQNCAILVKKHDVMNLVELVEMDTLREGYVNKQNMACFEL